MKKIGLNEIREKYIKFFEGKGHLKLPSFSLIPHKDPSLLLINSGMAPLKPYFIGEITPPSTRITTCQKCIRTPDIERVGKTTRHGTFFEMLGNFSFGDYFKREAITWSWEFVLKELELPKDRLWVSVYQDDDESFNIWVNEVGVPRDRIVRLGKKDNFWEIGTGPCGPCSEIYFDMGEDKGCGSPDCKVGCDCSRYIEFWNLVFTQFDKDKDGNYTKLEKPNIDTGMGLERIAAIVQQVDNLFEVDTVKNVLDRVAEITDTYYGVLSETDISIRVITDHVRSTVMMISDGIIPSNEGRGYVLRRLLRRAARHGRIIGVEGQFLFNIVDTVIDQSSIEYSELSQKRKYIREMVRIEEEKFDETIVQGLEMLDKIILTSESEGTNVIKGEIAFRLHDTFGFPIELTKEIANENGFSVDEKGFETEMERQKKMSREALKGKQILGWDEGLEALGISSNLITKFVGYEQCEVEAQLLYIIRDKKNVTFAQHGDKVILLLDKTPFYAESGGQESDSGTIISQACEVKIESCKRSKCGKYLHVGVVSRGRIDQGEHVIAKINSVRRMSIERNHTCTHLLHRALKDVLGEHVNQAGSLVESKRLRFDFTHFSPITSGQLAEIEKNVNDRILQDIIVATEEMSLEDAINRGATALFEDKYKDIVRVVGIDNYSIELCGGTHVRHTSQLGYMKIIAESGIASGIRRIEAITGSDYIEYLDKMKEEREKISEILKSNSTEIVKKVEYIVQENKNLLKNIESLKDSLIENVLNIVEDESLITYKGLVIAKIQAKFEFGIDDLRKIAERMRETIKLKNKGEESYDYGIVVIAGAVSKDKANLIIIASNQAIKMGIHSGNIIKNISSIIGGGGGGRSDMAQAGGKNTSSLGYAIDKAFEFVKLQRDEFASNKT